MTLSCLDCGPEGFLPASITTLGFVLTRIVNQRGPLPPAVTTSLLARSSRPFLFRGADRGSVGGGPTLDQEGSMPRLWRSPTLASKFCRAPTLHELGRDWEGRRTKHFVIPLLAFTLLVSAPVMAKAMVVVAAGMGSPTCAPFHGRSHGRGSA
ncbi:hypothetical protein A4X13_0g7579 [Tilletia indica]|uniref:Uncharacterized protein n=1 Tax=Tilletia indica TaxID=43049 RepID=A0A8T8SIL4_9BASI|nr:hypothetical protein A4X13_0g7579 [Tilletia indica]